MNSYTPWDISYLNDMGAELTRSIGVATNIGIKAFGIVCGIFLIVMIIRHFTGRLK